MNGCSRKRSFLLPHPHPKLTLEQKAEWRVWAVRKAFEEMVFHVFLRKPGSRTAPILHLILMTSSEGADITPFSGSPWALSFKVEMTRFQGRWSALCLCLLPLWTGAFPCFPVSAYKKPGEPRESVGFCSNLVVFDFSARCSYSLN